MPLNPDATTILWEAFNFLVLFVALYFVLFKPMMKSMKERARKKEQAMEQLQQDREEVSRLRAELESRLDSAEEEAEAVMTRARNQAEVERAALMQEAQAEVERILTETQMDAYRLKRQAVDEFHDELVEAVLDVSGLIIGRVAPDELHDGMVEQLCDSVWELGQSDMQRVDALRRSLGERTPTVMVRTAQPLSPDQQGRVARTFSALADRDVNVDLKVEPSLGLGMQVRLGDLVMDNTIAGRLGELRESVVESLEAEITNE
ncbi:MAG: F0F1 ATP synthase subunit delta [Anaerolineae bacterium]